MSPSITDAAAQPEYVSPDQALENLLAAHRAQSQTQQQPQPMMAIAGDPAYAAVIAQSEALLPFAPQGPYRAPEADTPRIRTNTLNPMMMQEQPPSIPIDQQQRLITPKGQPSMFGPTSALPTSTLQQSPMFLSPYTTPPELVQRPNPMGAA